MVRTSPHTRPMDYDDWADGAVDPLNPLHPFMWAEWLCPNCADDGDASDLDPDARCPNCGSRVTAIP